MATAVKEEPVLCVRHAAVAGRLRLSVRGLRRHPERTRMVESAISGIGGVRHVSGNPLTGNVLILFDPSACSTPALIDAAERILKTADSELRAERTEVRGQNPEPRTQNTSPNPQSSGPPWHALPASEVARQLAADSDRGLSPQDASARMRRFGPNLLPQPEEPSLLRTVVRQFLNAPTALLGVGAILSLATGAVADALLIGGVLAANTAIGTVTERSGQRAIAALRRAVPIRARVLRVGILQVLDAEKLVPGDTIRLLPGDPVPADARIWEAHRLTVEEAALTGESQPVDKTAEPVDALSPLADRRSMVYRGTTVLSGRATALVVATGGRTTLGQLHAQAAEAVAPPTPLARDLTRLGRQLVAASTGASLTVMALALLRGTPLASALGTAVALGVAALPEGLPTTATTVLALGSGRMRQKGTLIRSLNAAEALGSVTVVCADKTGTITLNRMSVGEIEVDGRAVHVTGPTLSATGGLYVGGHRVRPEDDRALAELLRVAALCSDAEIAGKQDGELTVDGSPTEGALLVAALKGGLDVDGLRREHPRIDRLDRGDGRRYMITVHRGPGGLVAMAKGAPDEMLELADTILTSGGVQRMDEGAKAAVSIRNAEMAARAMRVLGFARKQLPDAYVEADLYHGYSWCGLAGLVDPIRPGVPEAVRALRQAGIRTIMITGDQAATAAAVARELGLAHDGPLHVLEAGDLPGMNPEILRGLVGDVEVFARTPPEMKLAIVRALQANGEIVAMTGDGVNDAAALRAADVGVAMGERGTELARELADVVLSTDDFSKMVDAVEEGRLVRANVRRVLHYLLSTNASEVWAVAASVGLGLPSPLTPGQLLWLNLISDLTPALGLAMEPGDPEVMRRPPRDPKEPIIPSSLQHRILGESATLATGSLAAYGLGITRHGPGPVSQTMAFWSLATAQLLHVPLARAGSAPALEYERRIHPALAVGLGISGALQLGVLLLPPLRRLLGGARLGPIEWLVSLLAAVAPVAAIELQRSAGRALLPPGGSWPAGEAGSEDLKEAA